MILVDPQGPDGAYLLKPLLAMGLPAEERRLDAADIAFEGKGEGGTRLSLGVEIKRLDARSTDLIQSLRSGRLAGEQLPKMVGPQGAYDHAWLLVEGIWRHNESGLITAYYGPRRGWVPVRGKMSAWELEKRVLTLELCGGLHVRFTNTRADTVRFVGSLYRFWTDKPLDRHTSHLAQHTPPSLVALSEFRDVVARLPGVGVRTSLAVEVAFKGCLRDAINADAVRWADIATLDHAGHARRLGMKTAERIVAFCRRRMK